MYKLGKISSLAALIASALSPLYAWFILGDINLVGASIVMTLFLLWRHQSNIKRLLAKEES
jgi:glycerol-3-phosphate acyltransferase PlsY